MVSPYMAAKRGTLNEFLVAVESRPDLDPRNYMTEAVSNRDPSARYEISTWLLEHGADAARVVGNDKINALHVLLSQKNLGGETDVQLLDKLLQGGANINQKSPRFGVPLKALLENYALRDEDLGPFYDVIFAQPGIDWDVLVSKSGGKAPRTLREYVDGSASFLPEMARRMHEYEARHADSGTEIGDDDEG